MPVSSLIHPRDATVIQLMVIVTTPRIQLNFGICAGRLSGADIAQILLPRGVKFLPVIQNSIPLPVHCESS